MGSGSSRAGLSTAENRETMDVEGMDRRRFGLMMLGVWAVSFLAFDLLAGWRWVPSLGLCRGCGRA